MAQELDEYRDYASKGTVEFLYRLSDQVAGQSFLHVSAGRYGGGMAEILRRLVPMLNTLGINARWEVLAGDQEFFQASRRLSNSLQGQDDHLTEQMQQVYLKINQRTAQSLNLEADLVMIHDPPPAALIEHRKGGKWLWRCYLDIAKPRQHSWSFLRRFLVEYDAAIFSLPGFAHRLPIPQFLISPSIDPLSEKNRPMTRLEMHQILHVLASRRTSRFCFSWRGSSGSRIRSVRSRPIGWSRNTKIAVWCLPGQGVMHDPEGEAVLAEVQETGAGDPDIHVLQLPPEADLEINALQRAATIIFQKSIKEGFSLAVTEAMWKGKPVIGSTAGGLAAQISME